MIVAELIVLCLCFAVLCLQVKLYTEQVKDRSFNSKKDKPS